MPLVGPPPAAQLAASVGWLVERDHWTDDTALSADRVVRRFLPRRSAIGANRDPA